jgi:hypothetical protein
MQEILAHPSAVEPVCGTEIPGRAGTTNHDSPLAGIRLMLAMSEKKPAVIPGEK